LLPLTLFFQLEGVSNVHVYQCCLANARHRKCFRVNIFKLAQEYLAFVRSDNDRDGIIGEGFELVFKEESQMLKFQNALLAQCAYTTANKKPRYDIELHDQNAENDSNTVERTGVEVQEEVVLVANLLQLFRVVQQQL
jgi:hypothetical protein